MPKATRTYLLRKAKQMAFHQDRVAEISREIKKCDHPRAAEIIEALYDNQAEISTDYLRIVQDILDSPE